MHIGKLNGQLRPRCYVTKRDLSKAPACLSSGFAPTLPHPKTVTV